jgi:spore maturation protein CgeB
VKLVLISPAYFGYGESYARALRSLGHDVTALVYGADTQLAARSREYVVRELSPALGLGGVTRAYDARFNERVLRATRRLRPRLTLIVKGEVLHPETVESLGAVSPLVHWAYDDPYRYRNIEASLPFYSLVASFSRADTARLRGDGFHAMYLPLGYDPQIFSAPAGNVVGAQRYDVSFVGAKYPVRRVVLSAVAARCDVAIWGAKWRPRPWRGDFYRPRTALDRCVRGSADRSAANTIFRDSRINMNIHGAWDGLNMRVFEIPAAGGFQLCDVKPGIEEMFEPGVEVETFASAEEALEKVGFYLANESARRRVAAAGRCRAERDHTLGRRFETLLAAAAAV